MIGWVPTDSAVVVKVTNPLVRVCAPPSGEPLSKNCTVPVGVPDPGGVTLTVAVNITLCPNAEGVADDANEVVVFPLFT